MKQRHLIADPYVSPFLGILTGKKKEREAEARIKEMEAEAAAAEKLALIERDNLLLKLEAMRQGHNPEVEATQLAIREKEAEAGLQTALAKAKNLPETTMYTILSVVVAIVMAGIYLLKKK